MGLRDKGRQLGALCFVFYLKGRKRRRQKRWRIERKEAERERNAKKNKKQKEIFCLKGRKEVNMKKLGITIIVLCVVLWIFLLIHGMIYYGYWYDVKVGQYVKLSDDASTADVKLQYLVKYAEQVKSLIKRNDARYVFKRERLTRDAQVRIIETLVERLKQASEMNPKSFEYQQAMAQISGQEYDHTLQEIDGIMRSCWLRQASIVVFGLWISWLPCLIGCIIGVVVLKKE